MYYLNIMTVAKISQGKVVLDGRLAKPFEMFIRAKTVVWNEPGSNVARSRALSP